MFIRTKGAPKYEAFPKAASTVFAVGDAVVFNGSGQVTPAVAGSTTGIVGICKRAVAATDSDYAATTPILIDVKTDSADEFEVDANGAITAALIGTYKDIITNAGTISNSVATNTHVIITGLGSTSTKAKVRINSQAMTA
jgi:ribosomal protein L11